MLQSFTQRLPYLLVAVIVFAVFFVIARLVRASARAVDQRRGPNKHKLGLVLGRLAYGAILFLGLMTAAVIAIPGFTPGQLVSVLGLSSVAFGFAFKDILQNFLSGILILVNEPFRIGDQIVAAQFEGTVEEIQTRATFIRTYDGRRIVVPNAVLFTNAVIVNTANDKRRLEHDIGIGYGDDIALAKRVMLDTLAALPEVIRDPGPEALVVDLAESTINIRLRWWIHPPRQADLFAARDAVLQRVAVALHDAGVDLPFPTQQVLLHDQTEETDGDRTHQREGWPPRGQPPRPRPIGSASAATPAPPTPPGPPGA